ncbi:MAG: hypothetical protein ACREUG_04650 [Steroidobacteraceae bacterium]
MSEDRGAAAAAQGARPLWVPLSWLQADALEALAELNEQCLELLCEQAVARTARPRPPLLRDLEALWYSLDTGARRRAARCPFLLADAGFSRVARRPWQYDHGIRDRDGFESPAAFFTVPRTVSVTRLVLAYAWHLVRSEPVAGRLFLGLTVQGAELIAARSLRQVIQLAEGEPGLLRPRWADRLQVWRDLLTAAKGGEPAALERFRMRGLQLLAADASTGTGPGAEMA